MQITRANVNRSSLEKLASDNPNYRGKGGLTQKMRKRLTCAARCAIKMHSQGSDRAQQIKKLEKDLINGPLHCFGYHAKCSPEFCRTAQNKQQSQADIVLVEGNDNERNDQGLEDIAESVYSKSIPKKESIILYIKFQPHPMVTFPYKVLEEVIKFVQKVVCVKVTIQYKIQYKV